MKILALIQEFILSGCDTPEAEYHKLEAEAAANSVFERLPEITRCNLNTIASIEEYLQGDANYKNALHYMVSYWGLYYNCDDDINGAETDKLISRFEIKKALDLIVDSISGRGF